MGFGGEFRKYVDYLDEMLLTGTMDHVRHAAEACVQLYDRFYDDLEKRDEAEEAIRSTWKKIPRAVSISVGVVSPSGPMTWSTTCGGW